MRKALTRFISVFCWGKEGTHEKHESVGVLMVFTDRLGDEIQGIPTYLFHTATTLKLKAVLAPHS